MATRNNPLRHFLDLGDDQEFKLSAAEWNELLAGGWIEPTGRKRARLKRGAVGWIRGGELWLTSVRRMPSVAAGWFRLWLFRVQVVAASSVGESWAKRRERLFIERDRDAQNEALLWRTHRRTKGANEFRWIPPAHKAEILRALRPEPAG